MCWTGEPRKVGEFEKIFAKEMDDADGGQGNQAHVGTGIKVFHWIDILVQLIELSEIGRVST